MRLIRIVLGYWLEIVIGAILLSYVSDVRWFLFYLLVVLLVNSELRTDYLRKLIRVFQVANEGKLMGIAKKLNITTEELQQLGNEAEANMTEKQRKSLYQDAHDLGLR